ncbi:WD40 repeat domain-containing protein [Novipirellula sp. SH528]|uniref:WD40 repeat domain-containing protein n=1 Tax=Novipirellula sp. SH528 TaxID=3454466 RepID=UPI003FA0D1C5
MNRFTSISSLPWLFAQLHIVCRLRRSVVTAAVLMLGIIGMSQSDGGQPPITALTISADDTTLVAGSQLGVHIISWPKLDPALVHDVRFPQIHDLKFSPNGRQLLIAGGAAGEYGEWKLVSWPEFEVIATRTSHSDVIHSAAWLSDDLFVTGAADNDLIQWRLSSGEVEELRVVHGHSRRVLCVESMSEHDLVVSAGIDQVLRVWNCKQGILAEHPLRNLDNHTGAVCDLAVRPGGHATPYLASASVDRTVRFWQPTIGRLVRFARLPVEPASIAWSRDGERLAIGCSDGKLRILNPNTVEIEQTLDGIEGWIYEVTAADDGSYAVAGAGGSIARVIAAESQK